jgi:hypothetical protein
MKLKFTVKSVEDAEKVISLLTDLVTYEREKESGRESASDTPQTITREQLFPNHRKQ